MPFLRLVLAPFLNALAFATALFGAGGCGYYLQGSRNELLEVEGIRRVYVKPLVNNTYKPGVENVVYNALIRTLLSHRRVKLVQSEKDADAVLQGIVNVAQFATSGSTGATSLKPKLPGDGVLPGSGLDIRNTSVSSIYTAFLGCDFSLNRTEVPQGKDRRVWGAAFSRNKPFAASNQLDVVGTTSALINESEFERALSDMATNMMDDVHESMLAMF